MGVAAGPRGRECKTFTELKAKSPQIPSGIYHLFPNGLRQLIGPGPVLPNEHSVEHEVDGILVELVRVGNI